jgi:hypothetical protein
MKDRAAMTIKEMTTRAHTRMVEASEAVVFAIETSDPPPVPTARPLDQEQLDVTVRAIEAKRPVAWTVAWALLHRVLELEDALTDARTELRAATAEDVEPRVAGEYNDESKMT